MAGTGRDVAREVKPKVQLGLLEELLNWARSRSIWSLTFGLACCSIEMMAAYASHYDLMRYGVIPRPSPRQADLIIVPGTLTYKMAPILRRLYEQMPDPKYVLAVGSCAISGGCFYYDSYSALKGVKEVIPVDVFVPGCPPRPEAFFEGLLEIRRLIREGK